MYLQMVQVASDSGTWTNAMCQHNQAFKRTLSRSQVTGMFCSLEISTLRSQVSYKWWPSLEVLLMKGLGMPGYDNESKHVVSDILKY